MAPPLPVPSPVEPLVLPESPFEEEVAEVATADAEPEPSDPALAAGDDLPVSSGGTSREAVLTTVAGTLVVANLAGFVYTRRRRT